MTEIGKELRASRELAGLTQLQVAKKLKLTTAQYVSNVERGKCKPSMRLLKKWIRVTGMSKTVAYESLMDDYQSKLVKELRLNNAWS